MKVLKIHIHNAISQKRTRRDGQFSFYVKVPLYFNIVGLQYIDYGDNVNA